MLFRALIKNENFDTRDFTIFIANKKWVKNILRPLLELCAKDDRYKISTEFASFTQTLTLLCCSLLAMRCCGLALVLVKRLSDDAMKTLKKESKKKKSSTVDLTVGEPNEEDKSDSERKKVPNAREQIAALLSFKDALCSGMTAVFLCSHSCLLTDQSL